MANSRLPKKTLAKMNKREITKYERLMKEADKLFDHMDKVQRAATQYGRKIDKIKEPTAAQEKKEQKMINDGFRTMFFAHKKDDELSKFKKDIKKKYE